MAGACAIGALAFVVGFRLTAEVIPILAVLFVVAAALAGTTGDKPWLWGVGIGLGTRVVAVLHLEPPLSIEHTARYGRAQPLPLPFGLTKSPAAQALAGSILIMLFPVAGACLGWAVRTLLQRVDR
jgi:hypothetical protein